MVGTVIVWYYEEKERVHMVGTVIVCTAVITVVADDKKNLWRLNVLLSVWMMRTFPLCCGCR